VGANAQSNQKKLRTKGPNVSQKGAGKRGMGHSAHLFGKEHANFEKTHKKSGLLGKRGPDKRKRKKKLRQGEIYGLKKRGVRKNNHPS